MKLESNGELLVADFGGVEVRVGEAELAQIFIERIRSAAAFDRITAEQLLAPVPIDLRKLPQIGAEWDGGIYAGITVHDNTPMALVLLPGEAENVKWADAMHYAEKREAVLPSRVDALVLFQNVKSEFKAEWYWTDTVRPGYADYAFIQNFGGGGQNTGHKDLEYRARAVRRVAI